MPPQKSSNVALNNKGYGHMADQMIAGVSGGVISTVLLHPLDLVKVRFQVNEGVHAVSAQRPKYDGIFNALKKIKTDNGWRGLYQGVSPNILGAGASWGLYFMFNDSIRRRVMKANNTKTLEMHEQLYAGFLAGAATLTLTNPIWVAKTRLCLQYEAIPNKNLSKMNPVQYRGMADCLVKIYKFEGVRGLYKGFLPGLVGTSHGAIQMMVYEEMKKIINGYRGNRLEAKLNSSEYIVCAAISKVVAATLTYPYQVVRARLQDQHRNYNTVREVIYTTWRYESAYGFYKGLGPSLIRVVPACCITFVVYENMTQFLAKLRYG